MKRSKHTNYTSLETQIYEYKNQYYVLQMCQQGRELDPRHGPEQLASDFCALSTSLPLDSSPTLVVGAVFKALEDFDAIGHSFDEYDIKARNKTISSWFGARGMGSLEKNSRVVQVIKYISNGCIDIIPFDNHNINDWNGPMEDKKFSLVKASEESIGKAVCEAFSIATYHPDRKESK